MKILNRTGSRTPIPLSSMPTTLPRFLLVSVFQILCYNSQIISGHMIWNFFAFLMPNSCSIFVAPFSYTLYSDSHVHPSSWFTCSWPLFHLLSLCLISASDMKTIFLRPSYFNTKYPERRGLIAVLGNKITGSHLRLKFGLVVTSRKCNLRVRNCVLETTRRKIHRKWETWR
jgi:hypothetical protein